MSLLFPEFDMIDIQNTKSSPPSSQSANECPSVEEPPCCSKDLKKEQSKEEKKSNWERMKEEEGKRKAEESEESSEEEDGETLDEDLFIRNSGLISHAYSLDLNFSFGGCSSIYTSTLGGGGGERHKNTHMLNISNASHTMTPKTIKVDLTVS